MEPFTTFGKQPYHRQLPFPLSSSVPQLRWNLGTALATSLPVSTTWSMKNQLELRWCAPGGAIMYWIPVDKEFHFLQPPMFIQRIRCFIIRRYPVLRKLTCLLSTNWDCRPKWGTFSSRRHKRPPRRHQGSWYLLRYATNYTKIDLRALRFRG